MGPAALTGPGSGAPGVAMALGPARGVRARPGGGGHGARPAAVAPALGGCFPPLRHRHAGRQPLGRVAAGAQPAAARRRPAHGHGRGTIAARHPARGTAATQSDGSASGERGPGRRTIVGLTDVHDVPAELDVLSRELSERLRGRLSAGLRIARERTGSLIQPSF